MKIKKGLIIAILITSVIFFSCNTLAAEISVSNSQDWKDVYSIMLSSSLKGEKSIFINSKTIGKVTKTMFTGKDINIYESSTSPFINNLESQLISQDYSVISVEESQDFNVDLDPKTGNYYVISEDNPKTSVSLIPLAIKNNYWVFIIDEDNSEAISSILRNANSVIAVGEFRRDFFEAIKPYIDERINNKDPFRDSVEIARKYTVDSSVVLSDGSFLEEDFFKGGIPVLVSGYNKLGDSIFDFFEEEHVDSITIIGNEMAVVGEQIRERSNKEISVFIKYGQGTSENGGRIFALSEFPLPVPKLAITITKSIYDPDKERLVVYFENLGNIGLYELTSLSIKTDETEIASVSDEDVRYLGAGETLPVEYDITIPIDKITDETIVEYYTSFGVYPSELDNFLTMKDQYGPPFRTPLRIERLGEDTSSLEVIDAAYYSNLKRVGITLRNPGESEVYYSVKVEDLIIHGLEETLFTEDSIKAGKEKITYISAELDEVDVQDNEVFKLRIMYGDDEESKLNSIIKEVPFKVEKGSLLTGFAIFGGEGSGNILIIVAVILVVALGAGYFFFIKRK